MKNFDVTSIQQLLESQGYVTDREVATAAYLAMSLHKPLLVEGPSGVGKTEIAKVMAQALNTKLIRLQCYEGIDANMALYEWNYQRQLLHIRIDEHSKKNLKEREADIFSEPFLLKRPLLDALLSDQTPVLLIDEIDRSDEAFESFLLEILSDWQITIPEIGTISAKNIPYVVTTSNRTRELSDALRRRCLYLWIDYPQFEKELAIVRNKVPGIDERLAAEICAFIQMTRGRKLQKLPGVAETLDWAASLVALHRKHLDVAAVSETLGALFKSHDDAERMKSSFLPAILQALQKLPKNETWKQETILAAAKEIE
ncbi:MAG TPA: MoxR family ATPase [Acidobacteriota bacterium]|nr:MoxR family ATPase [Acidobacteriota bacterium]